MKRTLVEQVGIHAFLHDAPFLENVNVIAARQEVQLVRDLRLQIIKSARQRNVPLRIGLEAHKGRVKGRHL